MKILKKFFTTVLILALVCIFMSTAMAVTYKAKAAPRTYNSIKNAVKNKGYAFFEKGNYNLNLIGVRKNTNKSDSWDDWFYVLYKENGQEKIVSFNSFTTDPGTDWLKAKYPYNKKANPKGCAILVPGQYRGAYQIGYHNGSTYGYKALVQVGNLKVYRDDNYNDILDMDSNKIQSSSKFGINIHHGWDSTNVGVNSAGCQVFKSPSNLTKVLELCDKSKNLYGNSFTYTLLNETDIK